MNVLAAGVIVVACVAAAVGLLLLVRRRAPDGGFYTDGDRAAGVFGVLATGFAVLLGLVVVLAFTNYDESRAGAETEAITVAQQFEVANLLPEEQGRRLAGELVCYARSVVHEEWPRMEAGTHTSEINPWGLAAVPHAAEHRATNRGPGGGVREVARPAPRARGGAQLPPARSGGRHPGAALARAGRQRRDDHRLHAGVRRQRRACGGPGDVRRLRRDGHRRGTLLLIRFLDDPYDPGLGALKPVAMERTLDVLDDYRRALGDDAALPCDPRGRERAYGVHAIFPIRHVGSGNIAP